MPSWLLFVERMYLSVFNLCVAGAWGIVVFKWFVFLIAENPDAQRGSLHALLPYGQLAEFMSSMEIINGFMRLTGSSVLGALILHLGRGIVLFWVMSNFSMVYEGWSAPALLVVWGFGDISRFGYLALAKVGLDSKALKSFRYSIPLILFPLGVILEIVQVIGALLESQGLRYTIQVPRTAAGSHSADEDLLVMHIPVRPLLALFLITYIPGAPYMYRLIRVAWRKHMNRTRGPAGRMVSAAG